MVDVTPVRMTVCTNLSPSGHVEQDLMRARPKLFSPSVDPKPSSNHILQSSNEVAITRERLIEEQQKDDSLKVLFDRVVDQSVIDDQPGGYYILAVSQVVY